MTEQTQELQQPTAIVDQSTAVAMAKYTNRRWDRWENEVNRFGGDTDPITITQFRPGIRLTRQELDLIYEYDWISAKIIDIPADDAFRKWITLHHDSDPGRAEDAKKELERWNLRGLALECERLARLYGGALMVMGAFDGGDVTEPLRVEAIRKVNFINVVDRFMTYPQTFYRDPEDANFGEVETYLVHRLRVAGVVTSVVHGSRVIRYEGRYVPPVRRLRNFGWQNPVLTRLYEAIRQFGVSVQTGSGVLQDFVIKKLKIKDLQSMIAGGQWDTITTRLSLMAQEMAINNFAVYGEDENIEKIGTPVQGLFKIMELFIDYVSAASDIPRSRLFQNMTGTLGGDPGKNDLRVHYDNVEAIQENKLRSPVQQAIDILLVPLGFAPGEITFTWNPLWQMSDQEQAEIELKRAQTDQIYISTGVVEPEEVALSRFSGQEVDLRNMEIDVERREKAIEELKKVDLIRPEPEFDEQALLALQQQNGPNAQNPNQKGLPPGATQDVANITTKGGADPHRHTFDVDRDGNGQTVDTLDDVERHDHVIRSWRFFDGGRDSHVHSAGGQIREPEPR